MTENSEHRWPERIVIVRHGQSEFNVAKDLLEEGLKERLEALVNVRNVDIKLTEIGIWQAKETGKYLAEQDFKFDICYSSPYKRALQTAEKIINQFDYELKIFQDNRVREKEFGVLHGLTGEAIREQFPEHYRARKRDGKYWHRLLGGENYPDVEFRLHSFLGTLVRDWPRKNVLIAAHQVPCILFRALFEHLREEEVLTLGDYNNCGISEYIIDESKLPKNRMKLVEWNKVVY